MFTGGAVLFGAPFLAAVGGFDERYFLYYEDIDLARRGRAAGIALRPVEINGHPGLLTTDPHGRLLGVLAVDIADGRVQTVRSIVNPDKLRHLGPVGDLNTLL
jgi:hypothetical protein